MMSLLDEVLDAHGRASWQRVSKVDADVVAGGGLFPLKGIMPDLAPRRITVWLNEERTSVQPFGRSDQRATFTPERLAIEKLDGTLVVEWSDPRAKFMGHGLSTPWETMHRAYFNGCGLWTCLNTPFLLQWDGVRIEEEEPWIEDVDVWRVLRVYLPGHIASHCAVQRLYFGLDGLLRRHDFNVDIAGGLAVAQLMSGYIVADGIKLASRRRGYVMGPDRRPIPELLMIALDFANVDYYT